MLLPQEESDVLFSGVLLKKRRVFWREAYCILQKVQRYLLDTGSLN